MPEHPPHAHGCPRCGSDVLKRASFPIVGPLLKPFSQKRRYRCRDCGWTGWKHRLHRRSSTFVPPGLRAGVEPRAAWFFVAVIVFTIVVAVLLLRTWNESRSVEPPVEEVGFSLDRGDL